MVLAVFAGHSIIIWLYAALYYFLQKYPLLGDLHGAVTDHFIDCVYYSADSYVALGLGDVIPSKVLRFITVVESLNGLVFIGWSVSFTYFAMHKYWQDNYLKDKE